MKSILNDLICLIFPENEYKEHSWGKIIGTLIFIALLCFTAYYLIK